MKKATHWILMATELLIVVPIKKQSQENYESQSVKINIYKSLLKQTS
jgi:hypothetical protein